MLLQVPVDNFNCTFIKWIKENYIFYLIMMIYDYAFFKDSLDDISGPPPWSFVLLMARTVVRHAFDYPTIIKPIARNQRQKKF